MNIKQRLEEGRGKLLVMEIAKYVGTDKLRFKELINVLFNSTFQLRQCAAWPVGDILVEHPDLIKPYYPILIKMLGEPEHHPAVTRNILRALQSAEIPEKYQGSVVDACFRFISGEMYPVAIRAFAITTAANICRHYPELKNELIMVLNGFAVLPQQPAIGHRIKVALKELQK